MVWIKYKLVNGKVPGNVEDGGYFPEGDWLYGRLKEGAKLLKEQEFVDDKVIEEKRYGPVFVWVRSWIEKNAPDLLKQFEQDFKDEHTWVI